MNREIVKYLPEKSSQNNYVLQFNNKHYEVISFINLVKDYLIHTCAQKYNFNKIQLLIENICLMPKSKIDNSRHLII